MVSVRPEKIHVSRTIPTDVINCFEGRLRHVMYLGTHVHYVVDLLSGDRVTVMQPTAIAERPDDDTPIYVQWAPGDCLAIPAVN